MASDNTTTLTVQVQFQGLAEGDQKPAARAYLFDRAGRLADSKPVTGQNITFQIQSSQSYRVMVGPDLIQEKKPAQDLAAQLAKVSP